MGINLKCPECGSFGRTEMLSLYSCPACRKDFVYYGEEDISCCIYCGRDMLSKREISGALRPQAMIPFKVTREKAAKILMEYCSGKPLAPKTLSELDFPAKIKGFYQPVWVLSGTGKYSVDFKGAKSLAYKEKKIEGVKKDFYSLRRGGSFFFEDFLLWERGDIEPYYLGEAVPFEESLLEGFFSDKLYETKDEAAEKICSAVEGSLTGLCKKDLDGFSDVKAENTDVSFERESLKYMLVPLWVLNFNYDGKTHTFAVNGQTGKVSGLLPVGKGEYLKYFLLIFGIIAAAGIIIGNLI